MTIDGTLVVEFGQEAADGYLAVVELEDSGEGIVVGDNFTFFVHYDRNELTIKKVSSSAGVPVFVGHSNIDRSEQLTFLDNSPVKLKYKPNSSIIIEHQYYNNISIEVTEEGLVASGQLPAIVNVSYNIFCSRYTLLPRTAGLLVDNNFPGIIKVEFDD